MVQYVFTPWRDRSELLRVRSQFYPEMDTGDANVGGTDQYPDHDNDHDMQDGEEEEEEEVRRRRNRNYAVARVSMWMRRGNCPHVVESTALLTAAIVNDEVGRGAISGSVAYGLRASYAAAFSRFVTGLLDSQQDKQRKMSMFMVAKNIGLPATFVELRHQATHEQLPPLAKLRRAARDALSWIWEYYWQHLTERESGEQAEVPSDPCYDALAALLSTGATPTKADLELEKWGADRVIRTLARLSETTTDSGLLLRAIRLQNDLMAKETARLEAIRDVEQAREEIAAARQKLEESRVVVGYEVREEGGDDGTGWARVDAGWRPKPIGIV